MVPRASRERRIRAQERWEQFVIELASLMDGSIKRSEAEAESAWRRWHVLHQIASEQDGLDPDRLHELNQEDRAAFRIALTTWGDALVRAEWLAKRISGDYRVAEDDLRRFYTRGLTYTVQQNRWHPWSDKPHEDPEDGTGYESRTPSCPTRSRS